MKRGALILCVVILMAFFGAVHADDMADVTKHPNCPYCGMDRAKFAHSRMLSEYHKEKVTIGFCSLRCAAVDMAIMLDKIADNYKVGDYDTKKLIDAEKAYWVIGGDKMGVMTKRAKWAFENKIAAEKFIKVHGGTLATFDQAFEATYADMYQDNQMIRKKRQMMREKMKKKK